MLKQDEDLRENFVNAGLALFKNSLGVQRETIDSDELAVGSVLSNFFGVKQMFINAILACNACHMSRACTAFLDACQRPMGYHDTKEELNILIHGIKIAGHDVKYIKIEGKKNEIPTIVWKTL